MLDPKWLRSAPAEVMAMLAARVSDVDYEQWRTLDARYREETSVVEQLQARRNQVSKEIGKRKSSQDDAADLLQEMQELAEKLRGREAGLKALSHERDELALTFPNRLCPGVPVGSSAADNKEVRRWGTPPRFAFTPQSHEELGRALGILHLDRAAAMAGARYPLLSGAGALLERALISFMLGQALGNGYYEITPPLILNAAALTGTGQLPKFGADLFQLTDAQYYLSPTAEVQLVNFLSGEKLPAEKLPLKLTAATPCFRAEGGAAGQESKGLIRQHQFNKIELVQVTTPEDSAAALERLTGDVEKLLQTLNLPYRVIELCSADIGFSAARTYDLEVWVPSQERYREVSSCSNCLDFQARRVQLRYRPAGGKLQLTHTLNGSGLAVGRIWLAILENFQQADGSVCIPDVLRPYCDGLERITPHALV